MEDLAGTVEGATTLVCAPSMSDGCGGASLCTDLLSASQERAVLWITYTRSPAACIETLRAIGINDETPVSVIAVGETAGVDDESLDGVTVDTVSTPDDLTGLGIKLSQTLSAHDEMVVCFDSLTVLLQYVEYETAYEFLHAVTGQLYSADASAHFHLDPTVPDRRTVDAIASLFDVVVDCRDGTRSIRSRSYLQS